MGANDDAYTLVIVFFIHWGPGWMDDIGIVAMAEEKCFLYSCMQAFHIHQDEDWGRPQ